MSDILGEGYAGDDAASCWCCQWEDQVDWAEVMLAKFLEEVTVGRIAPGEVHPVVRWRTGGMRYTDIGRVADALERLGWARHLGNGLVLILDYADDDNTEGDGSQ